MRSTFLFLIILTCSLSSYLAQENEDVAMVLSKKELISAKETGGYTIKLPSQLTKEEVDKCAGFYVHNFTVNFDEETKEAKISMVTNDARNRQIIIRFVTACGVRHMNIEGSIMEMQDFFETYLK
jgi:hypothetical protein